MRKAKALMIVGAGLGLTLIAKIYQLRRLLVVRPRTPRTQSVASLLDIKFADPHSTARHRMVRLSLRQDASINYLLKHITIRHGLGFALHRPQELLQEQDQFKVYKPRVHEKARRLESRQMAIRHRRNLETDARSIEASFFVSVPSRSPLHPTASTRLRLNVMLEEISVRRRSEHVKLVSTNIPWTGGAPPAPVE